MNLPLDSELLRSFVAISDAGSFTRAAQSLHKTQSAVSMQVKRLESLVGHPLFVREARGVALTPCGETLLLNARRVLALLEETLSDLRGERVEGAVRIGVPEEYSASILPEILGRFAETHPAVEVTVTCGQSLALGAAFDRGDLDLAVLLVDQGRAEGEVLGHDPTVWATSARHLVHEQEPLPVALFDQGCWWRDWALKMLEDRGKPYRIAYSSASTAGLQAALSAGLAVAVMGASTVPAGARLLTPEEGFVNLPGSTIVLRRGGDLSTGAVKSMTDVIRQAFADRPS